MFWHAGRASFTYDETGHVQCGFYMLRHGDFERGLEHPPLIRILAGLPVAFLPLTDPETRYPQFQKKPISVSQEQLYGTLLIHRSPKVGPATVRILSRSVMIGATALLLLLAWAWSRRLYGDAGGLLTLGLLSLTPALLGHGSLVNTDAGGALGALAALAALTAACRRPSAGNLALAGLALGLAQVCKLSNLFLYPVFAFCMAFYPGLEGKSSRFRILAFIGATALSGLVINAAYGFQNFLPPHLLHPKDLEAYGWPKIVAWAYRWAPLPDFYLMSAGFMSYHVREGYPAFLLGRIHPHGVWYYFPVNFILRTPVSALLAILLAAGSFRKLPMKKEEFPLALAAGSYLAILCLSRLDLGIRHMLLLYPLAAVLAGRLASPEIFWGLKRWIPAVLVLGQLAEAAWSAPHFLSFYNFAVGGPGAGIRYSSDLDYGQGLKDLGRFMRERPGAELVLSYCGTDLPEAYGLDPQELMPMGTLLHSEKINSDSPRAEFLAVSASRLQGAMDGENSFSWLKSREPMDVPGFSIRVYDITVDPESHERLAALYERLGQKEKSRRHQARAVALKTGKIPL